MQQVLVNVNDPYVSLPVDPAAAQQDDFDVLLPAVDVVCIPSTVPHLVHPDEPFDDVP